MGRSGAAPADRRRGLGPGCEAFARRGRSPDPGTPPPGMAPSGLPLPFQPRAARGTWCTWRAPRPAWTPALTWGSAACARSTAWMAVSAPTVSAAARPTGPGRRGTCGLAAWGAGARWHWGAVWGADGTGHSAWRPSLPKSGAEVQVGEAQCARPLPHMPPGGFWSLGWGRLPGHHLWTHPLLPGQWDPELPGRSQTLRPSVVAGPCGGHERHPKDQACLWVGGPGGSPTSGSPAPPEVGRV